MIHTIIDGTDTAHLILPRQEINFISQPGTLVRMYRMHVPDMLAAPWLREDANPALLAPSERRHAGYASGGRSGLFPVEDTLYKLKGCRPDRGTHKDEPNGMQAIARAEVEMERTHRLRTIMRKERLEAPYAPIGYYRDTEPGAATGIMRAAGDTRLDSLLAWLEQGAANEEALQDVCYRLGHNAGAGLRLFHESGMVWNGRFGNAHPGNAVAYVSKGHVLVAPVDLDDAEAGDRERQRHERQLFAEGIGTPEVISEGKDRIYLKTPGHAYPAACRRAATKGFNEGYDKGAMTPLTLADLRRAKANPSPIQITRYQIRSGVPGFYH